MAVKSCLGADRCMLQQKWSDSILDKFVYIHDIYLKPQSEGQTPVLTANAANSINFYSSLSARKIFRSEFELLFSII